MDFLSREWMERYRDAWNAAEELVRGLAGFSALIEYGWQGEERPSAFLRIEDGRASGCAHGEAPGRPDFVMKATPEVWQAIRDGSLSGRAALLSRKLRFQGSMITAMKYMNAFEESIRLLGRI
ncbi:MAG: SCP2 sterol-binding domain-containing protein [Rhodocyclaceae bacterium]